MHITRAIKAKFLLGLFCIRQLKESTLNFLNEKDSTAHTFVKCHWLRLPLTTVKISRSLFKFYFMALSGSFKNSLYLWSRFRRKYILKIISREKSLTFENVLNRIFSIRAYLKATIKHTICPFSKYIFLSIRAFIKIAVFSNIADIHFL